jgi:hypothetical protein
MTTPTGPGITTPITTPSYVGSMVKPATGGQNLTPYQNVIAPAGIGGDVWGANGGGITPVFSPLPALANVSRAITQSDHIIDVNQTTVQAGMSSGAISTKTADTVYADDSSQQIWTADQESPGVADSQL